MTQKLHHKMHSWQEALWLLTVLLTPLFVNLWVEQQFEASKVWLLRTLVWLLATLWLYDWLAGRPPKQLPTPIGPLLLALFLIVVLATLFSPYRTIATFGSLERAGGLLTQLSYLALFLCVATRIDGHQSQRLLRSAVYTAVPIGLFALAQAAGWQPQPLVTDARTALATTLGRANFTGAYLALLLPLALAAAQTTSDRPERLAFWALSGLILLVVGLTQARAAWIAAAAGAAAYFWLRAAPHWSSRWRWSSAVAGLALASGGLLLVLQHGLAGGGSIAARWTIWQASLDLLWPRLWLGYGADTLELIFPAVYPPQLVYYQGRGIVVDRAHNWLLDWSLNYGIVATLVLAALLFFVLRLSWNRLLTFQNERPSTGRAAWHAAAMSAVCAHLVGNLFLFDVAATAVVFWLLLAYLISKEGNSAWPNWGTSDRVATFILFVALALCGGGIWQANLRPLLADAASWQGTRALQRGHVATALESYAAAVDKQPRRAPYHVALALTAAQMGRFEQAEASLRTAIELRPTDSTQYVQLASIFAAQGVTKPEKFAQAYEAFDQAITLAPTIAMTYRHFADVALRSGDLESALANAGRAVDLDATDGVAFGIIGWIELQNGRLAAAEAAFEQAVRWEPESADFHLGLAIVYLRQDELEKARLALETSLALDPAYPPALTLQLQLNDK